MPCNTVLNFLAGYWWQHEVHIQKIHFTGLSLSIAGCSSCSFFNPSVPCQVGFVAGMVAIAPIAAPVAIYENVSFNRKLNARTNKPLRKKIERGNYASIFSCLSSQCQFLEEAQNKALEGTGFPTIFRLYAYISIIDKQYAKAYKDRDYNIIENNLNQAEQLMYLGITSNGIHNKWLKDGKTKDKESENFDNYLTRLNIYIAVRNLQKTAPEKAQNMLKNCYSSIDYKYRDLARYPFRAKFDKISFCESVYLAYHNAAYTNNTLHFNQHVPVNITESWEKEKILADSKAKATENSLLEKSVTHNQNSYHE